jgi:hypothetical protein
MRGQSRAHKPYYLRVRNLKTSTRKPTVVRSCGSVLVVVLCTTYSMRALHKSYLRTYSVLLPFLVMILIHGLAAADGSRPARFSTSLVYYHSMSGYVFKKEPYSTGSGLGEAAQCSLRASSILNESGLAIGYVQRTSSAPTFCLLYYQIRTGWVRTATYSTTCYYIAPLPQNYVEY